MRPLLATVVLGVVVATFAGCPRKGPPSPDYMEARREFAALYGQHLEGAYLLPEMKEIEAKLETVPKESEHANEARALLTRIRSGKEREEGLRADREELARRALEPVGSGRFEAPREEAPTDAGANTAGAEGDAGSEADADQPAAGMPITEMTRRFGDCFLSGETILVEGRGERPTWKLRDTLFCRQRHPGFEERVVVEEAGAVLSVAERSRLQKKDR